MSCDVSCMQHGRRGDGIPDLGEGDALMTYRVMPLISQLMAWSLLDGLRPFGTLKNHVVNDSPATLQPLCCVHHCMKKWLCIHSIKRLPAHLCSLLTCKHTLTKLDLNPLLSTKRTTIAKLRNFPLFHIFHFPVCLMLPYMQVPQWDEPFTFRKWLHWSVGTANSLKLLSNDCTVLILVYFGGPHRLSMVRFSCLFSSTDATQQEHEQQETRKRKKIHTWLGTETAILNHIELSSALGLFFGGNI